MRVAFSPGAHAALRKLTRQEQRRVARLVDALERTAAVPGDSTAEDRAFELETGGHVLVCVRRPEMVLVASIEPVRWGFTTVARRSLTGMRRAKAPPGPRRTRAVQGMTSRTTGMKLMDLLLELRLAVRALRRDAGIVLLAVLVLGVGIGLPTAMYGMLDAMFLRGLPVEDAGRIHHVERRRLGASGEGGGVPVRDLLVWREQQRSFETLEASDDRQATVRIGNQSDRHQGAALTPGTFDVLRVRPALGRTLAAEDARPGAPPVVVVGHALWRDRMAASPAAVGSTITLDGQPHTVVGVMPPGFEFPFGHELWVPLSLEAEAVGENATASRLDSFGRLRDGVSRDEARAEFAVIAARLAEQFPETNENLGITVKPYTERMTGETATQTMYVFLAAVMLVLLVACANVTNLLLVRGIRRVRDMAVRAALGASRGRLALQSMLESLVLAVAGGALGIAVAAAALGLFRRTFGSRLPFWADMRLSGSVVAFVGLCTVLAAILAGLLPALRSGGGNLNATLRDESRGSTGTRTGRLMQGLVALEVALSVALLAVTGLLVRSTMQVTPEALGVPYADVLTAAVSLPQESGPVERTLYLTQLDRNVSGDAAAAATTIATALPTMRAPRTRMTIEGQTYEDDARPVVRYVAADTDFFAFFGAAPLRGRGFGPEDAAGGVPSVILNQAAVRDLFGNEDPLGRRVRIGGEAEAWRTVIGVVPNLWAAGLDASPPDRNPAAVYVPLAQAAPANPFIAVRVRGGAPDSFSPTLRNAAANTDPDVPITAVATMAQVIRDHSWFYGMGAIILAVTGAATLLLATAGLYGVLAFSVNSRIREFGIRLAMGADPRQIVRMVMRRGALQVVIGLVFGIALAMLIARGVSSLLFNVRGSDPLVLGGTVLLLAIVAAFSTAAPARRAANTDPLDALRAE